MDLARGDRLKHFCLVIGFTHGLIYLLIMWTFIKATGKKHHTPIDAKLDRSELIRAYIVMASLSLVEALTSFVLIAAIVKAKTVYMLPWLIVTTTTVITGMVYAVRVFPFVQMIMLTMPLTLSFLALFPVFFLYLKYKTISAPTPVYSTLNRMATAPPLATHAPAANNQVSETLDVAPPSYDAAMGIADDPPYPLASTSVGFKVNPPYPVSSSDATLNATAAPPYPIASSSVGFKANPPYPVGSSDAAISNTADPPYPLASSAIGFQANPPYPVTSCDAAMGTSANPPYPLENSSLGFPYPMLRPSTAPTLGWRSDLVQDIENK